MFSCDLHRFARDQRRCFRQRTENAASMKPARAFRTEDLFPINIARLQLRDCGVTTILTTSSSAHAKTTFGKVQAIANRAANTVEFHPFQVRLVHTTLIDQILDQSADCIVSQRRNDCGIQPEATLEPARNIVLSAAFPHLKAARRSNTSLAWIEPQHHLAETHNIPTTLFLRFSNKKAHNVLAIRRHIKHTNQKKHNKKYLCSFGAFCG